MILDYNDFVAAGLISGEPIKSKAPDYAVKIKTASGETMGKFDISTKDATEKNLKSFNLIKDISDDAKEKIAFFLNQAASYFGISTIHRKTASFFESNIIKVEDLYPPKEKEILTLKFAEKQYSLDGEFNIKEASEKLLKSIPTIPFLSTYKAANAILGASLRHDLPIHDKIKKLAHPRIGTKSTQFINLRKKFYPEHTETLNKIAKIIGHASPITVIDMIRQFDMATGFNSAKFGQQFFDIMEDSPKHKKYVDKMDEKVAEHALPNKESVHFINEIS